MVIVGRKQVIKAGGGYEAFTGGADVEEKKRLAEQIRTMLSFGGETRLEHGSI